MSKTRTKKFNGKIYKYYTETQYKNNAKEIADGLRLKGFYVRITGPMSRYGEYSIWSRKK